MLKARIIPVLLIRDGNLVKGIGFDSWRVVGHPLQAAKIHEARDVDELILLDISATPNGRLIDLELVREITQDCFMPLTVGGGVRTLEDIGVLLRAGADKVSVKTQIMKEPNFLRRASEKYGSQCLVASIDTQGGRVTGGLPYALEFGMDYDVVAWADLVERTGAGEILLNRIDRDGTMDGYDLDLINRVSNAVSIPVIACGGASGVEDCADAIRAGASAVAAGALFQFTDTTPAMVAQHFAENNIPVRI